MKIKHNHDDVSISQRWSKLKGCKKNKQTKKTPNITVAAYTLCNVSYVDW